MARAYLDVAPDMLPQLPALLPLGINVFGARDSGGSLRLILEGAGLPDGKQLTMTITDEPLRRTIDLTEVE